MFFRSKKSYYSMEKANTSEVQDLAQLENLNEVRNLYPDFFKFENFISNYCYEKASHFHRLS